MFRKFTAAVVLGLLCTAVQADDEKKADKKAAKFDKAKLFERIDTNKDGKVTKDEYKTFLEGVAEKMKDSGKGAKVAEKLGDVADRSFEKMDANKDGSVTKEEFEKAEGFGDAGGKIDPEKLKKLLKKKKGDGA